MATAGAAGGGTECKRSYCLDPDKNGGLNPAFDFTMKNGRLDSLDISYTSDPNYGNGDTTNTKGEPSNDLSPEAADLINQQIAGAINDAVQGVPDGNYRGKQKTKICWDVTVIKDKNGNVIRATAEPRAPYDNFGFDAKPVP